MKPFQALIINAIALIILGLWGYVMSPANRSLELIPIVFGLLFLAAALPLRLENRIVEFMLRILLVLLVAALCLSLSTAAKNADTGEIVRLSLMITATVYSLIAFMIRLRKRLLDRKKNRHTLN